MSRRTSDPRAAPALTVGAEPQQPKGFLEWCRDAAAPDEVRYTVTVLLAYLETHDCTTAARSLATQDSLDLENYAVTTEFGPEFSPMRAGDGVPRPFDVGFGRFGAFFLAYSTSTLSIIPTSAWLRLWQCRGKRPVWALKRTATETVSAG